MGSELKKISKTASVQRLCDEIVTKLDKTEFETRIAAIQATIDAIKLEIGAEITKSDVETLLSNKS